MFDTIYIKIENTLHENQYGFRQKRSAVLQVLAFLNKVYEYYSDITATDLTVLFLDFEKAFHKVPHGPLISKLSKIGITGKVLSLISSYLTNRTQIVKINKSFSSPKLVTIGVPQCSIVGPLFFIRFINDLPAYLTECANYGYCDDMKIVSHSAESLQNDNISLEAWCEENK